jgi:hypothetical protein
LNGVRKIEQSVFNGEVDQGSGTAIHTGRRRSMYLHPGSGPQNGKGQNGLPGNSRVEENSGILWPILHQRIQGGRDRTDTDKDLGRRQRTKEKENGDSSPKKYISLTANARQMMTPITDWHMRGSRKSMTMTNFRSEIHNESGVEL